MSTCHFCWLYQINMIDQTKSTGRCCWSYSTKYQHAVVVHQTISTCRCCWLCSTKYQHAAVVDYAVPNIQMHLLLTKQYQHAAVVDQTISTCRCYWSNNINMPLRLMAAGHHELVDKVDDGAGWLVRVQLGEDVALVAGGGVAPPRHHAKQTNTPLLR